MTLKFWLRRHPRGAVLATGFLALVISALPLAALHIADVPLLNRAHERSWKNVQNVQVSGEDLYLVQTLRKRNWQDFYWQGDEIEVFDEGYAMMSNYIGDLAEAGVLDDEWVDSETILWEWANGWIEPLHHFACTYMRDSSGFLTLSIYERDADGNNYGLWEQITLESTTGKIVTFFLARHTERVNAA